MPVAAADLIAFAAASMPTDDTSLTGGDIDLLRRVVFTGTEDQALGTTPGTIEVISNNASDTQNCTIVARKADGSSVTETLALTGVTAKIFAGNGAVERIQSVDLASVAIGTVTVRRSVAGPTISTIPPGERGVLRMFRNAVSSGSTKDMYEKLFWKNTHATLALLNALVAEVVGGSAAKITFAVEAVNGVGTAANRLTVPAGAGAFGDTSLAVSTGSLAVGARVGVWLKLSLTANDSPIAHSIAQYTTQISGQSA